MKKAIAAVSLCVALTLCMSLSAFAETGVPFDISARLYIEEASVRVKSKPSTTTVVDKWVESNDITYGYNPNMPYNSDGNTVAYYMLNRFGNDIFQTYPGTDYQFMGFKIDYRAYNDQIVTDPGYYMMITIAGNDTTNTGSFMGGVDLYFNGCIYDTAGNEYVSRTSPQFNPNKPNQWYATLLFRLGDGEPCEVRRILLESNMPSSSYGSMYYDVNIAFVAAMYPTEAQRILEEQKKAIEDAADQISGSIDDAADNIINDDLGYQEDPDQTDAKNGIQAIKVKIDSLSEDIDESVDDFSASIDGLKTSINSGKTFVWGWLDYVPVWVTAIIVGFAGILIARKVVK